MERLTIHTASGAANINYSVGLFSDGKEDYIAKSARRQLAIDRLAAYEDTGLEPETISKIRDIVLDISGNLDRLRELAQADREGRVVVLPCKVEDDVYINILGRTLPFTVISISQMSSTPTFKAQHGIRLVYIFKADDVGETVFMTRAEAEAALRRERGTHE